MSTETTTYRVMAERLEAIGLPRDAETLRREARGSDDDQPWYIHALAGLGGVTAGTLLWSFLICTKLIEHGAAALAVGLLLVGAVVVKRRGRDNLHDMFNLAYLALSSMGQGLIIYGLTQFDVRASLVMLAYMVMAAVLYAVTDERVHRFSVALAGMATALHLTGWELDSAPALHVVYAALVLLAIAVFAELRQLPARWRMTLRPAAYAAIILMVAMAAIALDAPDFRFSELVARITVVVPLGVVLGLAALDTEGGAAREASTWTGIAAALLGLVSNVGVIASMLVLVLGFWRARRPLIVLGSLSLVSFIVHFYYTLEIDLLTKSGILLGSGLVLLGLREALRRRDWMRHLLAESDAPKEETP